MLRYSQRGSGGRRRRVQHVNHFLRLLDDEIVQKFSVMTQCLGTHPCAAGLEIVPGNSRHQFLERAGKKGFGKGTHHFAHPGFPVSGDKAPKTVIAKGLQQFQGSNPRSAVSLPGKGKHGVGAGFDSPIDHSRKMHPKKRESGVRHRINKIFDKKCAPWFYPVVFAPERNDPAGRIQAARTGRHDRNKARRNL